MSEISTWWYTAHIIHLQLDILVHELVVVFWLELV